MKKRDNFDFNIVTLPLILSLWIQDTNIYCYTIKMTLRHRIPTSLYDIRCFKVCRCLLLSKWLHLHTSHEFFHFVWWIFGYISAIHFFSYLWLICEDYTAKTQLSETSVTNNNIAAVITKHCQISDVIKVSAVWQAYITCR